MSTTPSNSSHPFNHSDSSDVILRSSNGVDFYAHQYILSLASPFFHDLFSLKRHTPPEPNTTDTDSVIPVDENSDAIEGILRLCYPVHEPEMSDLSNVVALLGVAHKYDMITVKHRLRTPLKSFIATSPLQIFAFACTYELEDIACEAADAWRLRPESLATNFSVSPSTEWSNTPYHRSYTQEIADAPAGTYYRLLEYLRSGNAPAMYCSPPCGDSVPSVSTSAQPHPDSYYCCDTFLESFGNPFDINIHAVDETVFPAHRLILSMASTELRKLVKGGDGESLYLSEDSLTLAVVLRACYPAASMSSLSMPLSLAAAVLKAAQKYCLHELQHFAKQKMEDYIPSNPLGVFLHAADVGWTDGSRAAAVQLSRIALVGLYDPMMERIPARHYFALLKFHFEYRKALVLKCTDASSRHNISCLFFNHNMQFLDSQNWASEATEDVFPEFLLSTAIHVASHSPFSNYCNPSYNGKCSSPGAGIQQRINSIRTALAQDLSLINLEF